MILNINNLIASLAAHILTLIRVREREILCCSYIVSKYCVTYCVCDVNVFITSSNMLWFNRIFAYIEQPRERQREVGRINAFRNVGQQHFRNQYIECTADMILFVKNPMKYSVWSNTFNSISRCGRPEKQQPKANDTKINVTITAMWNTHRWIAINEYLCLLFNTIFQFKESRIVKCHSKRHKHE